MERHMDLTGQTYGRLTPLRAVGREKNSRHTLWLCRCTCGKLVTARADDIWRGHTTSCGCLVTDIVTIHGHRYTRLYTIWRRMTERCHNPKDTNYRNYGGRGIRVCEEWESYLAFSDWAMSHGYRDDLEIDRIDVNGNYEPGNCRWATRIEQANNTTCNRHVVFRGRKMTVAQFARLVHCKYKKVYYWLIRRGMTPEEFVELGPPKERK